MHSSRSLAFAHVRLSDGANASQYKAVVELTYPGGSRTPEGEDDQVRLNVDQLREYVIDGPLYAKELTRQFFQGTLAQLWGRVLAKCEANNYDLALKLELETRNSQLHGLRWEMLYDPITRQRLAFSDGLTFTRYIHATAAPRDSLPPGENLKTLALIASPTDARFTTAYPTLDIERHRKQLTQTLGHTQLTCLSRLDNNPPTYNNLRRCLKEDEWHILYLVCHGHQDSSTSSLLFEQEDRGTDFRNVDNLIQLIADRRYRPRLVVLASCASAGWDHDHDAKVSLGPSLAKVGVDAVIAMRDLFSFESAVRFEQVLFKELADHGDVIRAMTAARGEIEDAADCWAPVLFLQRDDSRIWAPAQRSPTPRLLEDSQIALSVGRLEAAAAILDSLPPQGHTSSAATAAHAQKFDREERAKQLYAEASDARHEQQAERVDTLLVELARIQSDYPDSEGLREWLRLFRLVEEVETELGDNQYDKAIRLCESTPEPLYDANKALYTNLQRQGRLARRRIQSRPAADLLRTGDFKALIALCERDLILDKAGAAEDLARILELPRAPWPLCLKAARLLSVHGDPRPGVRTRWPNWCELPGLTPSAGSSLALPPFSIARYPVTVWQYRQFVDAGGYDDDRWWTPEGRRWRNEDDRGRRTQPFLWNRDALDNLPVSGVTWYEAVAFCAWLTDWASGPEIGLLPAGMLVRLPSEAEWTLAASRLPVRPPESLQPWCNSYDIKVEDLTPVGVFVDGNTIDGVTDLIGNVWEWCASLGSDYPDAAHTIRTDIVDPSVGVEQDVRTYDTALATSGGPALRGGSFLERLEEIDRQQWRFSGDGGIAPSSESRDIGFRVALAQATPCSNP